MDVVGSELSISVVYRDTSAGVLHSHRQHLSGHELFLRVSIWLNIKIK
jgi:hypothetical protein